MKYAFKVLVCFFCSLAYAEEAPKKVVVYTDVAGDMFHTGHIEFFKKAQALS